jgi:hypothetical protein
MGIIHPSKLFEYSLIFSCIDFSCVCLFHVSALSLQLDSLCSVTVLEIAPVMFSGVVGMGGGGTLL